MGKLIYISNASLDGCTEDAQGGFDWAPPDDDVFAFITELLRSAGTYLYGRRMYEVMSPWETEPALAASSDLRRSFAEAWQDADKVVYSSTLASVPTARTRIERSLSVDGVRDLKAATERDVTVGGPTLAAQLLDAGLVDELHLFVWPVVLGGGKPALSSAGRRTDLVLLDERRFGSGAVYLRHRPS